VVVADSLKTARGVLMALIRSDFPRLHRSSRFGRDTVITVPPERANNVGASAARAGPTSPALTAAASEPSTT
jgi:hypothetical protein